MIAKNALQLFVHHLLKRVNNSMLADKSSEWLRKIVFDSGQFLSVIANSAE